MRQRVAFLRTLLAGKPVLLLDEPFASLDAITRAEMQGWLAAALGADPRTVVLVTHDVEEALYLCDRVVVLSSRPARPPPSWRPRRPAGARPRPRRHRAGLPRAARAGDGGAAGGRAVRRWLLPPWCWRPCSAPGRSPPSTGAIASALNLEDFLVPSPSEIAEVAVGGPLAARRQRLGDPAGGRARLRLRPRRRARLRRPPSPLPHPAPRLLPADRRLADRPDHRHRPDPGRLVRLRDRAEAGDHRPDLLLPDHRQRPRRPALGRPRGDGR